MAEKNKKKTAGKAQGGFMVRLPDWLKAPLESLKEKNRRPTTMEVVIALEKHLKSEGVEQPARK